ncbi:hypothetical protein CY34DRAFT_806629 [Suillus luteus UH-Slu-Lm8-n1]|uniref:Uncharacterized protein n=1 Tax=Suillus luteus UH-Slu-Lm8-n1 TaxID=930992 RepID=A0A0D0B3C5_9AGAM|nr:hypothetical protein CY34DRAFT_806629 [Suillus luteus UH-Slu-Lm8-n1]
MGSPMHLADLTRTAHDMRCALSLLPAGEPMAAIAIRTSQAVANSEKRSINANRSLMMMNTPRTSNLHPSSAADASGPSSLTSVPGTTLGYGSSTGGNALASRLCRQIRGLLGKETGVSSRVQNDTRQPPPHLTRAAKSRTDMSISHTRWLDSAVSQSSMGANTLIHHDL